MKPHEWFANNKTVDVTALRQSYFGSGPAVLFDLKCNGSETSLVECQHSVSDSLSCDQSRNAGIRCGGSHYIA